MASRRELIAGLMAMGVGGCQADPAKVDYRDVFDAVIKLLRRRYYDQSHVARMQIAPFEGKVASVQSWPDLYFKVLQPLLRQLPSSHVQVTPPLAAFRPSAPGKSLAKGGPKGTDFRALSEAVGLEIVLGRRAALVTTVRRGSPAFEAGVQPGSRIRSFVGEPAGDGLWSFQIDLSPEGQASKRHRWVVRPGPAPPRFTWVDLPDGPRMIAFLSFEPEQVGQVISAMAGARSRPVILDLRRNTGGLVSENTRLASALLPPGTSMGVRQTAHRKTAEMTREADVRFQGPLAVLIGPGSMSAAEVLACALRDHGRARLFGGQTSGGVLTARKYPLPDKGTFMLPVADYRTANGLRLEGVGVAPDVAVAETRATIAAGRDAVVDAAVAWLKRAA